MALELVMAQLLTWYNTSTDTGYKVYLLRTCGGTRASSTGSTSLRMAAPVVARLAASPAWPRMERTSSTMEDRESASAATCSQSWLELLELARAVYS